ncbi:MAG: deoxyribose-phosphate aldolase [Betaproteobacteria bacterium]
MNRPELARLLDHSVLKPEATDRDLIAGADVVRTWGIGYYCVQPCWVAFVSDALAGTDATVVTVVGFPHGCDRPDVKASAAALAVAEGAGEVDMVMNFGALRSVHATTVAADVEAVVRAVPGIPVKVILETAALTDEEKRLACRISVDAGAAFVKTSTGFHPAGGATVADVRLLRATVGAAVGVKASGGVRTLADTLAMIDAGANRIGTSASAAILAALDP